VVDLPEPNSPRTRAVCSFEASQASSAPSAGAGLGLALDQDARLDELPGDVTQALVADCWATAGLRRSGKQMIEMRVSSLRIGSMQPCSTDRLKCLDRISSNVNASSPLIAERSTGLIRHPGDPLCTPFKDH
jgi:hypothetical protein